jgi:hypothetical protein
MDEKLPEGKGGAPQGASGPDERRLIRVAEGASKPPSGGLAQPSAEPAAETASAPDETPEGLAGLVQSVAEPVVEHVVGPVVGALGTVIGAADQAISGRDAVLARRLRRRNREPLANLYELHPEARLASPRELGLRFVPLEEIRGTAVAGAAQRGGDFLPLKPFRGENWEARWRRIREANDRLMALPPVDLVKYEGAYWVVDGHNRVAVALYSNGAGLDAMVTELVPLDGHISERPTPLLGLLSEAGEMRAAAQGRRPAIAIKYDDRLPGEERASSDERQD